VLAWPGGRVIVVVAGLIIIAVGVAHLIKGVKKSFAEEIDTSSMSPVARKGVAQMGQIGYIAKGLALGLVGGLLSYATLTLDRQKQGLDGAMQTILAQPFGRFLLTAAALGFVAFGVFTLLQSRYRRMSPAAERPSASRAGRYSNGATVGPVRARPRHPRDSRRCGQLDLARTVPCRRLEQAGRVTGLASATTGRVRRRAARAASRATTSARRASIAP
jgi:hypothetical protein